MRLQPEKCSLTYRFPCISRAIEGSAIEVTTADDTLILNVKNHLEPEALLRIRITHLRGLDQPAGTSKEKALACVVSGLESLGVTRS